MSLLSAAVALGGCRDQVSPGGQQCSLDRVLIDASHVVRIGGSTGVVESGHLVRSSDPRADVFDTSPITSDAGPALSRIDGLDGFLHAGPGAFALIGQPRTDLPDEWTVHAVANVTDGSLVFVGPCGTEYDRQFAALRQAFDGTTDGAGDRAGDRAGDTAFLGRMVDEALLPGRGADLRNITAAPGSSSSEVTDPLAPRWEGRVRVAAVTVSFTPQGRAGAAGLQSEVGFFGIGVGEGLTVMTLDLLAVVPSHGAVRVVIVDELGQAVGTSLDLADTACRDAIGMYVSVNLVERTARCQPGVGTDTPAQVELAERALRFDDSVAVPDYADGPPSQE